MKIFINLLSQIKQRARQNGGSREHAESHYRFVFPSTKKSPEKNNVHENKQTREGESETKKGDKKYARAKWRETENGN